MANCCDMKKGEIYTCEDCDIELQVIKQCDSSNEKCGIIMCGSSELKKKA